MSLNLINLENQLMIDPNIVGSTNHHPTKGVTVHGQGGVLLGHIKQPDTEKCKAMLKKVIDAAKGILAEQKDSDKKPIVELEDYSFIRVEEIAAVTRPKSNVIAINNMQGKIMNWVELENDEQTDLAYSELSEAISKAGSDTPHIIDWDAIRA